jgi:hypothetical protein
MRGSEAVDNELIATCTYGEKHVSGIVLGGEIFCWGRSLWIDIEMRICFMNIVAYMAFLKIKNCSNGQEGIS